MELKISSGFLKRRAITLPHNAEDFRPTKSMVREAAVDSLMPYTAGASVADICAGSGAFGFEMISRGASHVTFYELNTKRCDTIKTHSQKFSIEEYISIINGNIIECVSNITQKYDIIYYDPPYGVPELIALVSSLLDSLTDEGILIFEHETLPKRSSYLVECEGFKIKQKKFGKTELDIYKKI